MCSVKLVKIPGLKLNEGTFCSWKAINQSNQSRNQSINRLHCLGALKVRSSYTCILDHLFVEIQYDN